MFKRLYYILLQRLYVFNHKNKPCQGKVYMFHNVNDDHDIYSITKDHFESLINYLVKNKKIVDADTLLKEKDPDNVVITFDDVYESVYRNAYPLLKEKDLPFYLFVSNEFLNKENYLNSEMLKEMLRDSKAILGSHNYQHELSRFMEDRSFEKGLDTSKKELEEEFGISLKDFAFPYGSMYACSEENIKDASDRFEHVFMTYAIPYNEEYGNTIPRINMNDSVYEREMK
nr:polysaccharide deacetylase family protein [Clostridia bacterium]